MIGNFNLVDKWRWSRGWGRFSKDVRSRGCCLLSEIEKYPDAVLVTGCQRSGTTMLTRILFNSEGMVSHWVDKDDELDGALLLAGVRKSEKEGRHCFQTTYLNECYREYIDRTDRQKIIWVIRNPMSVVYSLTYNWSCYALDELYVACGNFELADGGLSESNSLSGSTLSNFYKACYSYNGKLSQFFELSKSIGSDRLMMVDYDEIVESGESILSSVYEFLGLRFDSSYADSISSRPKKKSDLLSVDERLDIERLCMPVYFKAREWMDENREAKRV